MKRNKIFCVAALIVLATAINGCKKVLEEHPRAGIVPSFFNTPAGVLGGISGVYDDIRNFWGTEGFSLQAVAGTDEHLIGGGNAQRPFFFYENLNSTSMNNGWWNTAYQDINTLNGVLEFGQTVDLPELTRKAYLAQAKFLRAFWYYHLVLSFGDVPLHTTFITVPSSADSRAPQGEVYAQIIQDLTEASADLPDIPTAPFLGKAATKPTALYLLGKAYLTRGWSDAAQPNDFATALSTLKSVIDNRGAYGLDLWPDYADAFKPGPAGAHTNDYGRESLLVSDHSSDIKYGNYAANDGEIHGAPGTNLTPWFHRWNYPALTGLNVFVNANGKLQNSGATMMTRDVIYGRPYLRVRPNSSLSTSGPNAGKRYILDQAFSDRVNDSRYNNTFQTVWIGNKRVGDNVNNGFQVLTNEATAANNQRGITYTFIPNQDTAAWFTDFDVPNAPQFNGSVPFKGLIIPPRLWDEQYFPAVKKFDDPTRPAANFNWPSTRPVVIWRFSDVYLLAAEAAFKAGDNTTAADLINVVRKRAAFRTSYPPGVTQASAEAAMMITPGDITLDFILDERSREFFGEWLRWWDLVRTRSLVRRVKQWNPEAGPIIQDFHALRPVPQDQIDRVTEGPPFPQNPGY